MRKNKFMNPDATYSKKFLRARGGNKKRINRSRGGNVLMFLFLFLFGAFMVLPLIYTCITAFKPLNELFIFPPRFYVINPTLDNFSTMMRLISSSRVPFSRYLFNSVLVAVGGTILGIIIGAMTAFPLAKHKFKAKAIIYNIVVWAMMFRTEVLGIPQYLIIAKLGMINTYWSLLLPTLAGTMGVFLMRQFMESNIPDAVLEAARIDGAGEWYIFWKIAMPNVKPAWLTLAIFSFQSMWHLTGSTYIYDEPMKMLPTALSQVTAGGVSRQGAAAAVALVMMIPPIALFIFSQSSIMQTMSTSGLK
jgi:putative chitobiose transport system permease protein